MAKFALSRRQFIQTGAAAGVWSMSRTAPSFALPGGTPLSIAPARKALVFIMLDGGNDSYNMLVPIDDIHHRQYAETRSNLAHSKKELLPLEGYTDANGRTFGLHSAMPEVRDLFDQRKLSFVTNVGPMIERVTKESFLNGSARIPLGLLSHADQFKHWQTSRPDQRLNKGWFGYFADALQPSKSEHEIAMNISLAGNNIVQNGNSSLPYAITEKGSTGFYVTEEQSILNETIKASFDKLMSASYDGDPFKETYLNLTRTAQAQHEVFKAGTKDVSVPTAFSETPLSQELRKVAQTIKASSELGLQQQTFFLRYIGWDHHDELLDTQAGMLRILSRALGEFQTALIEMGLDDQVVTFTGSDFGRTLTSNGNGTDHGWGGNTIVMGTPVNGGQVFGDYPELGLDSDNPLDVGNGVLIPTTSTDQLYAGLAHWFGTPHDQLDMLFPNLHRFSMPGQSSNLKLFG
ncbi:DUF1501 domain-containing protein [Roseibium sp. RKSG952]|uniref:DUF1501 domain-containing protein n=1 Tax=Roseibium sp. RKSG952 TaxID=2529384 RepID=UPI0012BCBD8E|nr:DUF1501 domain-containing protein [Roseibium sp. RKSG952]MTI02966.1 DUF1501 domain-containing protein [Roseibium sp. RKSG952]